MWGHSEDVSLKVESDRDLWDRILLLLIGFSCRDLKLCGPVQVDAGDDWYVDTDTGLGGKG